MLDQKWSSSKGSSFWLFRFNAHLMGNDRRCGALVWWWSARGKLICT